MYTFQPFFAERYYMVTIKGEFTPDECKNFVQDMLNFADKINFSRFGSINDMREFTNMSPETQKILTDGMVLSLKVGFTVVGRVINTITDEMIAKLREANLKAGFVAQYFNDIAGAVDWVKKSLARYPDEPIAKKDNVIYLLAQEYPFYSIT